MERIVELKLADLHCSETHLRERTVISLLMAHKTGRADHIPPIRVYYNSTVDCFVIWDGNTRAYVASILGQDTIEAVLVPEGTPGEDEVMSGFRSALARGVRRVRDLTPYDVLNEDRWRHRPLYTKTSMELF